MKLLALATFALLLTACGDSAYTQQSESGYESDYEYEMENPYDENSGHGAGYEWAERTGGDCNGNSASFNEGCEEYYRQLSQ